VDRNNLKLNRKSHAKLFSFDPEPTGRLKFCHLLLRALIWCNM